MNTGGVARHLSIREARHDDIPDIIALTNRIALRNLHDLSGGFLVAGYDSTVYEHALRHINESKEPTAMLLVARSLDASFLGFLFGYHASYGRAFLGGKTEAIIDNWLGMLGNYRILKQIATVPEQRAQGIGKQLAESFLVAPHMAKDVFLTIVSEPENPASEAFHRGLGFVPTLSSTSSGASGETYPARIWRRIL